MFKTLLVDDNDMFRQSLKTVLSRNFPFMEIEEAGTGAAVLLTQKDHQLVFMDIRLPDTNGLELTRRLKEVRPDSLVCVVTQFDIPEYREAANQSGANEFFLKDNLTERVIVSLVDSMLATRSRILIVADDGKFRDFLCHLFDDAWPEVIVTVTGWADAAAIVGRHQPDMVLMEPRLGREGYDLLESISREYDTAVKVIVTGSENPEYRQWERLSNTRNVILKDQQLPEELRLTIDQKLHPQSDLPFRQRLWPKGRSNRKRR